MKVLISNFRNYINTENFKLIVGIMFIVSLYMVAYINIEYSYINSVLAVFSDMMSLIILLALFLINTINTIKFFDSNKSYIIRCGSKRKYLKQLTKSVLINNTFVYMLEIIMLVILLIFFNRNGIIIDKIGGYSISNLTYTVFYLIRTFILVQCISLVGACLYKAGHKIILWILTASLIIAFMNTPYRDGYVIEDFETAFISPTEYLHVQQYKDFGFELEISFFYILGWLVITYIVYLITAKRIKQIGD